MDLQAQRKKLDRLLSRHAHLKSQMIEERQALAEARHKVEAAQEAQQLIQKVAEEVQRSAHQQIASVVSTCLKTVFGDDAYEFQINFVRRRGRTEADLVLVRDGLVINPADSAGGGVLDVTALGLRLACLLLTRPAGRRLIVADEPFRFLSREYRSRVRDLLLQLGKDLGIQWVVVTHHQDLVGGEIVDLGDE